MLLPEVKERAASQIYTIEESPAQEHFKWVDIDSHDEMGWSRTPRFGAAPLRIKDGAVVEVGQAGQGAHDSLAVVLNGFHEWIAPQV